MATGEKPRSQPILITFSGIDGSGKSTQIEKLRSRLSQAGLQCMQLAFWDNVVAFPQLRAAFSRKFLQSEGGVGTPEKPVRRNDKNRQGRYLTLGRSLLHIFDALNLRRAVAKARSCDADIIIFDRYLYDQVAALPLRKSWVKAYARLLLKLAPRPNISYLLDSVPEAARARKPEYPLEFLHRYRQSYLELQQMANLVLIPAAEIDVVHAKIIEALQQRSNLPNLQSGSAPVLTSETLPAQ